MKKNKDELIDEVKRVKAFFKEKGITREEFFDNVYGPMCHKQNARIINLWSCKICDEDFNKEIVKYAKNRTRNLKNMEVFQRFAEFVEWYMSLGGKPLTPEQIEETYVKFIVK